LGSRLSTFVATWPEVAATLRMWCWQSCSSRLLCSQPRVWHWWDDCASVDSLICNKGSSVVK
jgi:hypothetical protein